MYVGRYMDQKGLKKSFLGVVEKYRCCIVKILVWFESYESFLVDLHHKKPKESKIYRAAQQKWSYSWKHLPLHRFRQLPGCEETRSLLTKMKRKVPPQGTNCWEMVFMKELQWQLNNLPC